MSITDTSFFKRDPTWLEEKHKSYRTTPIKVKYYKTPKGVFMDRYDAALANSISVASLFKIMSKKEPDWLVITKPFDEILYQESKHNSEQLHLDHDTCPTCNSLDDLLFQHDIWLIEVFHEHWESDQMEDLIQVTYSEYGTVKTSTMSTLKQYVHKLNNPELFTLTELDIT
jgi:hypothetical protein